LPTVAAGGLLILSAVCRARQPIRIEPSGGDGPLP
jgi:hypothetical protein